MTRKTFYEDIVIGEAVRFGAVPVVREEVIAFASKYDPQPFHLSDEAAARTQFGRLAASGWHTCGMAMSLIVQYFQEIGYQSLGGGGVDELRWMVPVYPGDVLSVELSVLAKRRSATRPAMGLLKQQTVVLNQDGVAVCRFLSDGLVRTRDPEGTD